MKDFKQTGTGYYNPNSCDLSDFKKVIDQTVLPTDVPNAAEIEKNVPIYDMNVLASSLHDPMQKNSLMTEWAWVLKENAGAIVLRNAYSDTSVIDQATKTYEEIIKEEKLKEGGGEDHFAAAGANDRIWNSLQKLCESSPDVFFGYFANEAIQAACEAWLGPNYQMTAQVNLVHPGGSAQQAHRDYHLGFRRLRLAPLIQSTCMSYHRF